MHRSGRLVSARRPLPGSDLLADAVPAQPGRFDRPICRPNLGRIDVPGVEEQRQRRPCAGFDLVPATEPRRPDHHWSPHRLLGDDASWEMGTVEAPAMVAASAGGDWLFYAGGDWSRPKQYSTGLAYCSTPTG